MKSVRGGAGRGQGRKTVSLTGEVMKTRHVRMADAEWSKCLRLGGSAWVRQRVVEAPEPPKAAVDELAQAGIR